MKAIVKQQKTGYYVQDADGKGYQDAEGHGWFSKAVARDIARELGGMYYDGNKTTVKQVVTGYTEA